MDGIIIVDKPKNITSHDAVLYVRKKLAVKKAGHAGTLDPIATGVLIILIGKATKLFPDFLKYDKIYEASITFGVRTNTGDMSGRIIETKDFSFITEDKIKEVLNKFIGRQFQQPHPFSARHFRGERLYMLSRRGIITNPPARLIEIKEIRLLELNLPIAKFYLRCSSGTYVRKLAEDIAESLDTLGFISEIRRLAIGPFGIDRAIKLSDISQEKIIPLFELNGIFQDYSTR